MRNIYKLFTLVVAMVFCAGGGGGVAGAEVVAVADVTRSAETDDGWRLSASLESMTIDSVPNMAATAFTREGFVSGKAVATIDGNGDISVNSGNVVLGVQVGCQINLSEGASLSGGGEAGLGLAVSDTIDSLTEPFAGINGNVSINLLPGTITNVGLGTKPLKGRTGTIFVHDAHVKVDACGGPVSIRFFTSARIDTDKSEDSVNTYGDILTL